MKAALTGRDARTHEAEVKAHSRYNRITHMFRRLVFYIEGEIKAGSETPKQIYVERISSLRDAITQAQLSPDSRRIMHRLLHDYSLRLLDGLGVNAKPFIPPMLIARSHSRRTETGLQTARLLQRWDERFKECVLVLPHADVNVATLCGLICWSAMSRAMLLDERLVRNLFETIKNPPQPLFVRSINSRLAIPLRLSGPGVKRHNIVEKNDGADPTNVRVHYFYPDGLTLALIERRLRIPTKTIPSGQTPFEAIRQTCWGRERQTGIRNLSQICNHGFWLADLRERPTGSEAIAECYMGHWDTIGLDPIAHALLLGVASQFPRRKASIRLGADSQVGKRQSDNSGAERLRKIVLPRRENAHLKAGLQEFVRSEADDSIAYAIAHWFKFLLDIGRKPSTIETYYGRLGVRLTDAFGDTALSSFDATDFHLLYSAIIDDVQSPLNRAQIAERITQFHVYCAREFGLPPLLEPLSGGSGQQLVRARYIPAKAVHTLMRHLAASVEDARTAHMLEMVVLLALRGGLRIGEIVKLRLRDIEASDDLWLFIVPNRYGPNKSHAARRQIPFGHLLKEAARDRFLNYVKRQNEIRTANEPLLVDPVKGAPLDPRKLGTLINAAMNTVLGGQGWAFHHLRHTAANNMFLALEQAYDLAKDLAGWDAQQTDRARAAILGDVNAKQKRYLALASFMGHASPSQTFESYIHLVPQLVATRVGAQSVKPEAELYAAAGGQQLAWIKRKEDDDDFARGMARRLAANWVEPRKRHTQHHRVEAPVETPSECTHKDVFAALRLVEQGVALDEVAERLKLEVAVIDRLKARAEELARLETQRGASRLFAADRIARARRGPAAFTPLLPTPPRAPAERVSANAMQDAMSRKLNDPALTWSVHYFLGHSHPQKSGLSFKRSDDLQRFLNPFRGTQWMDRVRLSAETKTQFRKDWDAALAGALSNDDAMGPARNRGIVRLSLAQKTNSKSALDRGSNEMRYVLHMMAIMSAIRGHED